MANVQLKDRVFIHCGSEKYDPSAFESVKDNKYRNKPTGGLWVSDKDAELGWMNWCEQEDFRLELYQSTSFSIKINPNANVYIVDSVESANNLFNKYADAPPNRIMKSDFLSFEKMLADGIDAIDFQISKCQKLYDILYGWDCDSTLILNKEVIIPLKGDIK